MRKNCNICEGTGIMYTQNGPDDTNAEMCFCESEEYEEVDLTFPHEKQAYV